MEPEKRSPREMTYQAGWKRRKIVSSREGADVPQAVQEQQGSPGSLLRLAALIRRWNDLALWKEAPLPAVKLLAAGLWILPAALFALFVWMVHVLSRFS